LDPITEISQRERDATIRTDHRRHLDRLNQMFGGQDEPESKIERDAARTERVVATDEVDNVGGTAKRAEPETATTQTGAGTKELSQDEQQTVRELRSRDAEVRAHEAAHLAGAGSAAAGGPSYTFQMGPDGRSYAIGGEVPIDMSPGATPAATLAKAQAIRGAALAPANPSGADRSIAAAASQMAQQAQAAMAAESAARVDEAQGPAASVEGDSVGLEADPTSRGDGIDPAKSDKGDGTRADRSNSRMNKAVRAYTRGIKQMVGATLACTACGSAH
jgi:hypothetical protein